MKFDVKVNVDNEELGEMLEATQVVAMMARMLNIDLDDEYVDNSNGTYEFRYKFELTKEFIERVKQQNQNNFNDVSELFS